MHKESLEYIISEFVEKISDRIIPDCDYDIGDRVFVAHVTIKDKTPKAVKGTVIECPNKDEYGWYCRIKGDNGNHYRVPLKQNEVRKGTTAILE
jgi:hypothetical protein